MSELDDSPVCPIPRGEYPNILLAHGSGGRLMHQLIDRVFRPAFGAADPELRHDGAVIDLRGERIAFTTDSYVVQPLFFPGGDIGRLAVNGTVNDLAMCGAEPLYLSAGFIIEEGLTMDTLWAIVRSMSDSAKKASVRIVTGDTKVVDRGKGDGLFINTAGIGRIRHQHAIGPGSVKAGDIILLNGDIGRHGIAIMAQREGLTFESEIRSDCAPLWRSVNALIASEIDVHCLRDLTRGGLATTLAEIARHSGACVSVNERDIPIRNDVQGACEILGLDPMYVANEGRFIAFIPRDQSDAALDILRSDAPELDSRIIGEVTDEGGGQVTMTSVIGTERLIEMLSGEQLPRIC